MCLLVFYCWILLQSRCKDFNKKIILLFFFSVVLAMKYALCKVLSTTTPWDPVLLTFKQMNLINWASWHNWTYAYDQRNRFWCVSEKFSFTPSIGRNTVYSQSCQTILASKLDDLTSLANLISTSSNKVVWETSCPCFSFSSTRNTLKMRDEGLYRRFLSHPQPLNPDFVETVKCLCTLWSYKHAWKSIYLFLPVRN